MNNEVKPHALGKAFEGMEWKDVILVFAFLVLVGAISNWVAIKMAQQW